MKEIKPGDKVKILPFDKLIKVLRERNFCGGDNGRKYVADKISGKQGEVATVEEKYMFDYFFLSIDGDDSIYSIPYEAIDFD